VTLGYHTVVFGNIPDNTVVPPYHHYNDDGTMIDRTPPGIKEMIEDGTYTVPEKIEFAYE